MVPAKALNYRLQDRKEQRNKMIHRMREAATGSRTGITLNNYEVKRKTKVVAGSTHGALIRFLKGAVRGR